MIFHTGAAAAVVRNGKISPRRLAYGMQKQKQLLQRTTAPPVYVVASSIMGRLCVCLSVDGWNTQPT